MIQYSQFCFASAPRTASTWVQHATKLTPYDLVSGNTFSVHRPFVGDYTVPRLSMVRHPLDWLLSYWYAIGSGILQTSDSLKDIGLIARRCSSPSEFVQAVADEKPGIVGRVFSGYEATSMCRVEDLPYSYIAFLMTIGPVSSGLQEQIVKCPVVNKKTTKHNREPIDVMDLPKHTRRALLSAEAEYCDRFEYY